MCPCCSLGIIIPVSHHLPRFLLVKDDEQFEVEAILDHQDEGKGKRTKRSYLVSWRGYSPEDATWEPECNLKNCSATLQE